MSRKMKDFSAKIILDSLAFLAISVAYLIGRFFSGLFGHHDGMI